MKRFLLIVMMLIGYLGFSQTLKPMTWSGIITDNSGNPLQNTNVNLKFSVFLDNIETYSEIQLQTTDDNGFITANIGTGTAVVGNYDTLWLDTVNSKLKIEADTGSGFVTLQDSPITAVPMAKGSEVAWHLEYGDNYVSASGSNILINSENNINFLIDDQQVGAIESLGLKLNSLAAPLGELENVPVEVTPSGYLQRGTPVVPQDKYLNISGSAFAAGSGFYFDVDGLTNNTGNVVAPFRQYININLPHGATIKNIKVFFKDNNNTSNLSVGLYSHTNNFYQIATLSSSGLPSSASTQTLDSGTISHTVNNLTRGYFLLLYTASWPADNTLKLDRVLITYEE